MSDDETIRQTAPTRRDTIKYGGTIVAAGALSGCVADDSEPSAADGSDGAYTAELAPMGEVTFESVPEDVFTILTHHADMALALGRGDAINALHAPGYSQSLWRKFTHHLDGVTVDWEGLYSSWEPTKEKLYELDSDVHLADPAKVDTAEGWDRDDIEEIETNVAPWFGNTLSGTQRTPSDGWDDYEYYTLWEIFERVARVFQAEDRYEALAAIHESLVAHIETNRPAEPERPDAAMVLFSTSGDGMWGYKLNHPGYYAAHTRPMGVEDALADAVGPGYGDDGRNITLNYELLLEADPEVLLVLGPMSKYHNIEEIRSELESHEVAGEMTAVEEGRVYTQGVRRQGPLANLFQLEMTAKQLYPEQFGAWPGYTDGDPYPEIPAEEQLFDRQRVADIINGDIRT